MKRLPNRSLRPVVDPLETRRLLDGGLAGTWLGQDGHDLVGPSSQPGPDGIQDIHIALTGLASGHTVTSALVTGLGGGAFQFGGITHDWAAAFVRSGPTTADVYIEPYQVETGRSWTVTLNYDDGSTAAADLAGGTADPHLRLVQTTLGVTWDGQDGHDLTGPSAAVGPDGVQDVHLVLNGLRNGLDVQSVRVDGVPGISWQYGLNRQAVANAEFVRADNMSTQADLYFSPDRDLTGQALERPGRLHEWPGGLRRDRGRAYRPGVHMPAPPPPPARSRASVPPGSGRTG